MPVRTEREPNVVKAKNLRDQTKIEMISRRSKAAKEEVKSWYCLLKRSESVIIATAEWRRWFSACTRRVRSFPVRECRVRLCHRARWIISPLTRHTSTHRVRHPAYFYIINACNSLIGYFQKALKLEDELQNYVLFHPT